LKKAENAGIRQGDFIVVALLLVLSAVLICIGMTGNKDGSRAIVCVDGKQVAVLSLNDDTVYEIPGGMGNTVEIIDGQARMMEADCPDKSCINQGYIKHAGECIVCLPARVTVTIISSEDAVGLDAVAY